MGTEKEQNGPILDINQSGINIKKSTNKAEIGTTIPNNDVDIKYPMSDEYWIGVLILILLIVLVMTFPHIKAIFFDKNKKPKEKKDIRKKEFLDYPIWEDKDNISPFQSTTPNLDSESDKNTKQEEFSNEDKSYMDVNPLNEQEKFLKNSLKSQFEQQTNHLVKLDKELKELNLKLESFAELTMEKEEKIKRYEEGYDQKIAKNFRKDIFDLIDFVEKENRSENKSLTVILDDLDSILFNLTIEKLDILEKKDYDLKQVTVVDRVLTDNPAYHNKVAKVLKNGYFSFITENQIKILRRAEITIYVNQNKGIKNG